MRIFLAIMCAVISIAAVAEDKAISIAENFIKLNEGFRSTTYTCSAGKPTIGYGFTDKTLTAKGKITKKEADIILHSYVIKCLKAVDSNVKVKLTAKQRAVLADFVFHFGSKAFKESTLLKQINAGASIDSICFQLSCWKYAKVNGKKIVVVGLVNRCNRRINLYKEKV